MWFYQHNEYMTQLFAQAKKELLSRFEKAEIAAIAILVFIFFAFPLAIFLSGLAAYGILRYWQHGKNSHTYKGPRKLRRKRR